MSKFTYYIYIYREARHDFVNTKSDVMDNFKFYHGIFKFEGNDTFIFLQKPKACSLSPPKQFLSPQPTTNPPPCCHR